MDDNAFKEYLGEAKNAAAIKYKNKGDPYGAWTVPFVTGHRYRFHWKIATTFDNLRVTMSERWEATDKNIHLTNNFTDIR